LIPKTWTVRHYEWDRLNLSYPRTPIEVRQVDTVSRTMAVLIARTSWHWGGKITARREA